MAVKNHPSQSLRLRPEFFSAVRQGEKRSTIRAGRRKYKVGSLVLQSNIESAIVQVTEILYKQYGELTEEDAQTDGFATLDELRKTLKRFYPNLRQDSALTIIYFQLPNTD